MMIDEALSHLDTYSSTMGSGQTTQEQHEDAKRVAIDTMLKYQMFQTKYVKRLKADMVDMLTDIWLEIKKKSYYDTTIIGNYEDEVRINLVELDDVNEIIQQKINSLKSESER